MRRVHEGNEETRDNLMTLSKVMDTNRKIVAMGLHVFWPKAANGAQPLACPFYMNVSAYEAGRCQACGRILE